MNRLLAAAFIVFLAGCQSGPPMPAAPSSTSSPVLQATPTVFLASTPAPSQTPAPTFTPTLPPTLTTTPSPTDIPLASKVCSPLADVPISELTGMVTAPFQPPPPGRDDGHFGVDLSFWRWGTHQTMQGLPIYSILPGQVSTVVLDRYPYGNMVIIETTLSSLAPNLLSLLNISPEPTPIPGNIRLICPALDPQPAWDLNLRSLYVLYAHMDQAPTARQGEKVACGQSLGAVGTTGGSVNPHLHLETRLGPAGAAFTSLSHYRNSATEQEKASYCTWRVSGLFQPFNPLILLH